MLSETIFVPADVIATSVAHKLERSPGADKLDEVFAEMVCVVSRVTRSLTDRATGLEMASGIQATHVLRQFSQNRRSGFHG